MKTIKVKMTSMDNITGRSRHWKTVSIEDKIKKGKIYDRSMVGPRSIILLPNSIVVIIKDKKKKTRASAKSPKKGYNLMMVFTELI